jgi:hypothetical protein
MRRGIDGWNESDSAYLGAIDDGSMESEAVDKPIRTIAMN